MIEIPVQPCKDKGKPGYKWGKSGKCYVYTSGDEASRKRARAKAVKQGKAIQVNKCLDILSSIQYLIKSIRDMSVNK